MELKITEEKAEWNESKLGSEKLLCVVQFPNCISTKTGKSFKWMPTYKEIAQIMIVLEKCEERWKKRNSE